MNPLSEGIHQTHLALAHRCMRQLWFYLYTGPAKPNYAMAAGIAGHASIEHGFRHKMTFDELPEEDILLDVFTTRFNEELERCERGGRVDPASLRDRMTGCRGMAGTLPLFFRQEAPLMQPKFVEQAFKVRLPRTKIPLVGTIDYFDKRADLIDFKFRSGSRIPTEKVVNRDFQLQSYRAGVEIGLKEPVHRTIQIQLVCNPGKAPEVKRMQQTLEDGNLSRESILNEYAGIIRFVEKAKGDPALYPMTSPTNWWCDREWCGWANKCPRFGGNHE